MLSAAQRFGKMPARTRREAAPHREHWRINVHVEGQRGASGGVTRRRVLGGLLAAGGALAMMGKNRAKRALPPAPRRAMDEASRTVDTTKHAVQEARR